MSLKDFTDISNEPDFLEFTTPDGMRYKVEKKRVQGVHKVYSKHPHGRRFHYIGSVSTNAYTPKGFYKAIVDQNL